MFNYVCYCGYCREWWFHKTESGWSKFLCVDNLPWQDRTQKVNSHCYLKVADVCYIVSNNEKIHLSENSKNLWYPTLLNANSYRKIFHQYDQRSVSSVMLWGLWAFTCIHPFLFIFLPVFFFFFFFFFFWGGGQQSKHFYNIFHYLSTIRGNIFGSVLISSMSLLP